MTNLLDLTLQIRKGFYVILKNTPRAELLKIPEGFNNNIWWNIAHVAVTQQKLIYGLCGLEYKMPQELMVKFMKGTVPDGTATDGEIEMVKGFLFSTIEATIEDYENELFQNFKEYPTSAGITLKNLEDALAFNLFHEGLHMGSVLALQKAVKL